MPEENTAEAENEAYDNTAARQETLKYVNKIRVRAGVRQYTTDIVDVNDANYIHVDDNQEAIRKIVRMERRVETELPANRLSKYGGGCFSLLLFILR